MKGRGEEGGKGGESRQDLWGLQGCMEQMQNNLTLPPPNAVLLTEQASMDGAKEPQMFLVQAC